MKLNLYTIRLCRKDEYEKLIDFFRHYWSENHIFCKNREIFEFQHGKAETGTYDFVIAVHNETQEIHAVLGYITSSRYDLGNPQNPEAVYGALWKVRDDVNNPEINKLGLGVMFYLIKKFPKSPYINLGLSHFSQDIYNGLHFKFGLMGHYYIAAKHISKFSIAENPAVIYASTVNNQFSIRQLDFVPENFKSEFFPNKTPEYIKNRYTNHPFYKYLLLGIFSGEELLLIWVVREIQIEGSKCIRLVDMTGSFKNLPSIEGNVHEFLKERDAEFIDCYNHGINKEEFINAGFHEVEGSAVIPNYFEPFCRKNIDIHYAYYSDKPVVIFKGDADQDRPSLI